MARPIKAARSAVIVEARNLMSDKQLNKTELARRFKVDRRTINRILRAAIDAGELPHYFMAPRPFEQEVKPKLTMSVAWT